MSVQVGANVVETIWTKLFHEVTVRTVREDDGQRLVCLFCRGNTENEGGEVTLTADEAEAVIDAIAAAIERL